MHCNESKIIHINWWIVHMAAIQCLGPCRMIVWLNEWKILFDPVCLTPHVPNMHPVFKFVCFCYRNQLSLLHSQGSNDCYADGSLAFQTNDRNMHAQILWLTKSISSDHLLINHLSFPSPSSSSSTPPSSSSSPSSCSGLERHQQLHPRPSAAFSTLPGEWADISSGDIHTCRMIMIFYMMMIIIFCMMIIIIFA